MNRSNLIVLFTILILTLSVFSISAQSNFQNEQKWFSQNNNGIQKVLVGDFNGDRLTDIAYFDNNKWWVMTCSKNQTFNPPQDWSNNISRSLRDGAKAGDFNGDSYADIVTFDTTATTRTWYVSITERDDNGKYYFAKEVPWITNTSRPKGGYFGGEFIVGDFNGDGMDDIAFFNYDSNSDWTVMVSTGSGFKEQTTSAWCSGYPINEGVWTGDFNGDGITDKVSLVDSNKIYTQGFIVSLSNNINYPGTPLSPNSDVTSEWFSSNNNIINPSSVIVGDFNGDSKSDIAFQYKGQSDWNVITSTGKGFNSPIDYTTQNNQSEYSGVWSGDFNGDGYSDKLTWINDKGSDNNGWWVAVKNNTDTPIVGMWYYPTYHKLITNKAIDASDIRSNLWRKNKRDPDKIPVVGFGTDTLHMDTSSNVLGYDCSNPIIIDKQFRAMKKIGVDFVILNITDGLNDWEINKGHRTVPNPYDKKYSGDYKASYNSYVIANYLKNRNRDLYPQFCVALGYEFWGKSYYCDQKEVVGTWTEAGGLSDYRKRQINAVDLIYNKFVNKNTDYFDYLGKPLLIVYLASGKDYPIPDDFNYNTKLHSWYFPRFTIRNSVNWGLTFHSPKDLTGGSWVVTDTSCHGKHSFTDGIDTKRYWSWGAGVKDDRGVYNIRNNSLPKDYEEMAVMPGTHQYAVIGKDANINRRGGDFYLNSWKQVIAARPKVVTICNWNNWNEETAIEGCVGPDGWKDRNGLPTWDWYLKITQKYIYILKHNSLPDSTYNREEGSNILNLYANGTNKFYAVVDTVNHTGYPKHEPDILLPKGWLSARGFLPQKN